MKYNKNIDVDSHSCRYFIVHLHKYTYFIKLIKSEVISQTLAYINLKNYVG